MVTGTEYGSENWLPEQKMVIKYGYRNNFFLAELKLSRPHLTAMWQFL
jgi:hypothetical protein